MTTSVMQPSDRFSWHRVMQVASFYGNLTKRQLLVYVLATFVFACLILIPTDNYIQIGIFTMTWTAMGLLMQLAPVVLGKSGDSRIIERLIPASAAEKMTFFLIYFWIVIPFVCYFLPEVALLIYKSIPYLQNTDMMKLIEIHQSPSVVAILMNIANTLGAITTCLYVVMKVKRNRVLWGIISVFAFNFILGIIGAVNGFIRAFNMGFDEGRSGYPMNNAQAAEWADEFIYQMNPFFIILTCVLAIYVIWICCMIYKNLNNSTSS